MSQVFRDERIQRDVRGAGAVLLWRGGRRPSPELADGARHGRAAGGQKHAAEDAAEAHAAAAPVREDCRATVRGERARLRGAQQRVADGTGGRRDRVDRIQRGPLAAGHTGRAGRYVQLSGAEDLHAVVLAAAAAAAAAEGPRRQRRRAVRQTRQRHRRHDVPAQPHLGPHAVARLETFRTLARGTFLPLHEPNMYLEEGRLSQKKKKNLFSYPGAWIINRHCFSVLKVHNMKPLTYRC